MFGSAYFGQQARLTRRDVTAQAQMDCITGQHVCLLHGDHAHGSHVELRNSLRPSLLCDTHDGCAATRARLAMCHNCFMWSLRHYGEDRKQPHKRCYRHHDGHIVMAPKCRRKVQLLRDMGINLRPLDTACQCTTCRAKARDTAGTAPTAPRRATSGGEDLPLGTVHHMHARSLSSDERVGDSVDDAFWGSCPAPADLLDVSTADCGAGAGCPEDNTSGGEMDDDPEWMEQLWMVATPQLTSTKAGHAAAKLEAVAATPAVIAPAPARALPVQAAVVCTTYPAWDGAEGDDDDMGLPPAPSSGMDLLVDGANPFTPSAAPLWGGESAGFVWGDVCDEDDEMGRDLAMLSAM